MSWLDNFVDRIQSHLSAIRPDELMEFGRPAHLEVSLPQRLPLDALAEELLNALGATQVGAFFSDTMPSDFPVTGHLIEFLVRTIPRRCNRIGTGVSLDKSALLQDIKRFADAVQSNRMTYTVSLRVSNIDIDEEIVLDDGVRLRTISQQSVLEKYPVIDWLTPLPVRVIPSWYNHRVEAVIERTGHPSEIKTHRFDFAETIVNSILHAFIVAKVPHDAVPHITHMNVESPIENSTSLLGVGNFRVEPQKLSADDISAFRRAYALLKNAQHDRILEAAIDRFVLGRRRSQHHPHRMNAPNWDKIVDYVISLESLLLTINRQPAPQELSYRFSLNGAALLRTLRSHGVFELSDALKTLYGMRSKGVHGSEDVQIAREAVTFLRHLRIVVPKQTSSLSTLRLVCETVERWITELLYMLDAMPVAERPYIKKHGWEKLLFGEAGIAQTGKAPSASAAPA